MLLACRLHIVQQGLSTVTHNSAQRGRLRQKQSRTPLAVACKQNRSETALTSVLLASVLALTPAFAKTASSDYISVQERLDQRTAFRDRASSRRAASAEAASTIPIQEQVKQVKELSSKAQAAVDAEDYEQALKTYSQITHQYPDLAIVQYARVKHALMLFQSGKTIDAVLEMEGQEEEMRGNAEVHAALAAMLYSETPRQIIRAETQWEIAREFDQRYGNLDWVKREKQWPPKMQAALGNFLNLT